MKKIFVVFILVQFFSSAQNVGINPAGTTPNSSAILDLNTGNDGTQGFLPEHVSLTATNVAAPVTSPATGLLVYNTNTAGSSPTNVSPGYYYWNGSIWVYLNQKSKASVPLPYENVSFAPTFNNYTAAYTPVSGYNYPTPLASMASISSVSYWGTYNNTGYILSSNGSFSHIYGWLNSGTTGTVTAYAYLYTFTNGSNAALTGVQIGSASVTVSIIYNNYFFEIDASSTPFTLSKGQMIIMWFYPSVSMSNFRAGGTLEVFLDPQ